MLYRDINSCVALEHGTCTRIQVNGGIRQGCNSSPLLFILLVEQLSIMIKKNNGIDGIDILERDIIISQFADDMTLFKKNERHILKVLDSINQFSKASGLKLNIDKCEIFAFHDQPALSICNIAIKTQVKYLGIVITRNKELREREHVCKNVDKCKTILNSWLQRDITVFEGFAF